MELLAGAPGIELVICDEGHRLKNAAGNKTSEALRRLERAKRIILLMRLDARAWLVLVVQLNGERLANQLAQRALKDKLRVPLGVARVLDCARALCRLRGAALPSRARGHWSVRRPR